MSRFSAAALYCFLSLAAGRHVASGLPQPAKAEDGQGSVSSFVKLEPDASAGVAEVLVEADGSLMVRQHDRPNRDIDGEHGPDDHVLIEENPTLDGDAVYDADGTVRIYMRQKGFASLLEEQLEHSKLHIDAAAKTALTGKQTMLVICIVLLVIVVVVVFFYRFLGKDMAPPPPGQQQPLLVPAPPPAGSEANAQPKSMTRKITRSGTERSASNLEVPTGNRGLTPSDDTPAAEPVSPRSKDLEKRASAALARHSLALTTASQAASVAQEENADRKDSVKNNGDRKDSVKSNADRKDSVNSSTDTVVPKERKTAFAKEAEANGLLTEDPPAPEAAPSFTKTDTMMTTASTATAGVKSTKDRKTFGADLEASGIQRMNLLEDGEASPASDGGSPRIGAIAEASDEEDLEDFSKVNTMGTSAGGSKAPAKKQSTAASGKGKLGAVAEADSDGDADEDTSKAAAGKGPPAKPEESPAAVAEVPIAEAPKGKAKGAGKGKAKGEGKAAKGEGKGKGKAKGEGKAKGAGKGKGKAKASTNGAPAGEDDGVADAMAKIYTDAGGDKDKILQAIPIISKDKFDKNPPTDAKDFGTKMGEGVYLDDG